MPPLRQTTNSKIESQAELSRLIKTTHDNLDCQSNKIVAPLISSLLSHSELFIHSIGAHNEHSLSSTLGSFSDALCFMIFYLSDLSIVFVLT